MTGRTLYLLGLKHSGKSTIGRKVSGAFGMPFVDLDTEIRLLDLMRSGMRRSVRRLFVEEGAQAFRELEAAACRAVSPGSIVATGGGICDNGAALAAMDGVRLFLDEDAGTLFARVLRKGIPPFLETSDPDVARTRFIALCERRRALYLDMADATVDLRGLGVRRAVEVVTRRIGELYGRQ